MFVQIARTFENGIQIQTFEKWHRIGYRYIITQSQKHSIFGEQVHGF